MDALGESTSGTMASTCHLQEFDKKYNPTWHCVVGRNFGSYAAWLMMIPTALHVEAQCQVLLQSQHFCVQHYAKLPATMPFI
jgi:hypothetical protein